MDPEELLEAVRITLKISKSHWVSNGTPIKPEDAELVAKDVAELMALRRASTQGTQ